jgi:type I restriction enzyme S subunit
VNAKHLIAHFDNIAEAPEGIPRLRSLVLDMAAAGALSRPEAGDESAETLAASMRSEKDRLVKSGQIRRGKPVPAIGEADLPSDRPAQWQWGRLGDLSALITKGTTPTSVGHSFTSSGVNFVKIEAIREGKLLPQNITSYVSPSTHDFLSRSRLEAGDILFSIAGSIGTSALVTRDVLPANTNQALALIRGTNLIYLSEFVLICLRSSLSTLTRNQARGGAMNNISLEDVRNFVMPVVAREEQARIVRKANELMALCDELEEAQTSRERRRDRLATASQRRLVEATGDDKAFHASADFYLKRVPRLTTRPEHIAELRRTIIDLAVRGVLAHQNPNDQPISELRRRIRSAASEAAASGKKARQTIAFDIEFEPFEPPPGWLWMGLGETGRIFTGNSINDALREELSRVEDGRPFIATKDVGYGRAPLVYENGLKVPWDNTDLRVARPQAVFICAEGGSAGRKIGIADREVCFGNKLVANETWPAIEPRYILWVYQSAYFLVEFRDKMTGVIGGISRANFLGLPVPIPPQAEQKRIVARVDELMRACDELEARVNKGRTTQARLLESVLYQALHAAS